MANVKAKFGKVAVLYGGDSAEREVSLRSGIAVIEALQNQGVDVVAIDATGHKLVNILTEQNVDRCLIMLHGGDGEDGHVQALLHELDIPYTGSNTLGCALAMDKMRAKKLWQAEGFPTPKAKIIDHKINVNGLNYPLAIKPVAQGSSVGTHRVNQQSELKAAYLDAAQYGEVMAEEWIIGKELTVSIVDNIALPSIWIEPKLEFYNYEAKYTKSAGTRYHCPSGISKILEDEIKVLALKAFVALGCSGWGRVDFMLSPDNQLYLIEANTVPGMTNLSLVPQAAKQYGWSFEMLVLKILESSL
ncbi:D-alanine--D-alanine ligase [Fastidiosibacter lacustris]|uniref:D-alanine--D-alanine ligase n=1 Tax=Fastidiosibacter lacustris TaxID=2056695 RepID=UPI000E347FA1|nr:D-alanine--D-alanine ligase [Fastidiosibacter lacustris]